MIAFYYGITGFACVWFYRKSLTESARSLWLRGILPLLGGLNHSVTLGKEIFQQLLPALGKTPLETSTMNPGRLALSVPMP